MPAEGDELSVGDLAYDTAKCVVGEVMEIYETHYALRPPKGGIEWDGLREFTRRATLSEQLSPALAERNANSRLGV
ncbi:hypothetical protein [Streptomyces yaizuensis]|uniref:Uncharacterized protein n=1 Tax=Streptomyces yaizuensis TaxID=2989713 RepID=A0ABQ5P821_9ACTN|nr:hypothetical protein [Streptomyces sp. YSPA8]GLF98633.1 hypothetical protein SYYSPA8_30070 [Streptomyces sp. YSPA8]